MLHPVGDLPAAVYWRRRVLVLLLLIALLGGGGWLAFAAVTGQGGWGAAAATTSRPAAPVATPALERVVPSLAGVRTATPAPTTEPAMDPAPATAAAAPAAPPVPAPGSPCTDDMLRLEVRAPASVAVGDRPTFDLVVTNTAPVPCVRALDKGLQELVLLDAAGARVWGSNDCFPEASSDLRTLAPGEAVAFPVVWSRLTSEPGCAAPRVGPPPGAYVLRGRLDTKTTPDAPVAIG